MSDELEALARKGRAGQAKNQSAQQARQSEEQKAAEKERERALSKALGGRGMWAAAIFVIMFVVGGIAVAYLQSTGEPWGTPVKIGFFVGAVVFAGLLVVSQRLEKAHHRKLAMAWLEALPFEFAIDAYLDGLARERMTTKVSLTVRFETPPADDKRDLVADAASGAADVARTRWENQALHIRSAPLSTYRSGNADRASTYTNAAVHRWFCALVDNGLLAIHANYPVREVTCEMTN